MTRIRTGFRVRRFCRAWHVLFALGCSCDEESQVARCLSRSGEQLLEYMRRWTRSRRRVPRIWILCVGQGAPELPLQFNKGNAVAHQGVWLRELVTTIAYFNREAPIERIVAHEVGHALLDLLTHGFPFPRVVHEGVARTCEYYFGGWQEGITRNSIHAGFVRSPEESNGSRGPRSVFVDPSRHVSIRELLEFNAGAQFGNKIESFTHLTDLSFWLFGFLFELSRVHPRVMNILYEPRVANMSAPLSLYRWLLEVTELSSYELELSFRRYCTGVE